MTHLPNGSYRDFQITRKGKSPRKLVAPSKDLLAYQRSKLPLLYRTLEQATVATDLSGIIHGFVKNRNCVTAAEKHIGFQTTIIMDISNFFDNVTPAMVQLYSPYTATDPNLWHQSKYAGQGFATSPMIANLAILPALYYIDKYLNQSVTYITGYALTIYADDLQISFNSTSPILIDRIIEEVTTQIEKLGLSINQRKTRVYYAKHGYRRMLGISVGQHALKPSRKVLRKIRAAKHQSNGPSLGGLTTYAALHKPKLLR